ncbi:MAG: Kdo hydroxylase family protein [Gemmataceae bacterium]
MSIPGPEPLERGELIFLPKAPFALPEGDDLAFLLGTRAGGARRKHVCFDPRTGELTGLLRSGDEPAERMRQLLETFSRAVIGWLDEALPAYRGGVEPDRTTFRPEEEATRRLRPHARNDLLHVDAFPGRPAHGRRILRVYANVHPTEPRVWATSEPLPRLLSRFGDRVQQSRAGWFHEWGARLRALIGEQPSPSDVFMLRLHDYLKSDLDFQQRGPRRLWRFPPGSAWLAMTDACTHADLRGRFALEHSFFVAPHVLACPELAPANLLRAA